MKKLIIITIVVVGAISAFGFALKPETTTTEDQSQIATVKVGAEKSGFTETTSW
ncbi:MAG TPA: hypothetical protein VIS49_06885 [Cyclobacteriaceae bacterium]